MYYGSFFFKGTIFTALYTSKVLYLTKYTLPPSPLPKSFMISYFQEVYCFLYRLLSPSCLTSYRHFISSSSTNIYSVDILSFSIQYTASCLLQFRCPGYIYIYIYIILKLPTLKIDSVILQLTKF